MLSHEIALLTITAMFVHFKRKCSAFEKNAHKDFVGVTKFRHTPFSHGSLLHSSG